MFLAMSWAVALLSVIVARIANLVTRRPMANGWRMAMVWLALGLAWIFASSLGWRDPALSASVLREVGLPSIVLVAFSMLLSERYERRRRPFLEARRQPSASSSSSRRHT